MDSIRADFPVFSAPGGADMLRFDGPGGTQVPGAVIDAVTRYLIETNGNTHWNFPASRATDALLLEAREAFAQFFNGQSDEVVFGANMTTLTMHLARGLGREWGPGDEIVVTELDHHGNVAPWEAVAAERGVTLRWLPMDPADGTLQLDALPSLLSERTRVLAITAASNALGTIPDVGRAAAMAHDAGALVMVDAVHHAHHRLPDVAALGADFLVCSPYKFYGPHCGVLWGRRELLERVRTPKLRPAPDTAPERLETGTGNFEAIAGAAAALHWMAALTDAAGTLRERLAASYHQLHQRESELFEQLWDGLNAIPGLRTFGLPPGGARTGTVTFTLAGESPAQVAKRLSRSGCSVTDGDFYAST
ncbi:MAG TPA: cysteine desulfurase-like protein, partial [Gemmatimonadales bacterium]|nr:cysteine desulfurase-like protein [Gemmatimonadales bacterium]